MFPECRHIKTSGGKCGSPALRGQPFCYFHSRLRERTARTPRPFEALELPPLEDRGAIQLAISEIVTAVANYKMDHKRAGVLLYALQIASHNAKNSEEIVSSHAVSEVTRTEHGEEMAPEGATAGRPEEETLQSLLIAEVRRQAQESRELNPDQTAQIAQYEEFVHRWEGDGDTLPDEAELHDYQVSPPDGGGHAPAICRINTIRPK
jgi:hypothetical protein